MSTIFEDRDAYLKNPYFKGHIFSNFSPFYATIAVCTILGVFVFAVNLILGCCSKHKHYWQDRHTGNRWLVSIWSATPHNNPPLDLTELKDVKSFQPVNPEIERPVEYTVSHHRPQITRGHIREEYVELHKKESDI